MNNFLPSFIEYELILDEFKFYKSTIDYKTIFENLDDDIIDSIYYLTDIYYEYFLKQIENNLLTTNINIPNVSGHELDIIINIMFNKNSIYSLTDNINNELYKIALTVYLPKKQYVAEDYLLQTIFLPLFDINDEYVFKNSVYNILFYSYIIKKYFIFNPALFYLNHEDDVNELAKISENHLKLFGNDEKCSVCMELTIYKTKCKHNICLKCFGTLEKKICPICRKVLTYSGNNLIHLFLR